MNEKYKFQEMLVSILDVARVQLNRLTIDEIKQFFGDMELNDSQYEHIFAYLTANGITIEGYTDKGDNEYTKVVQREIEMEVEIGDSSPKEEVDVDNTSTGSTTELKADSKQEEEDSMYLKMYLEDISGIKALTKEEENAIILEIPNGIEQGKSRLIEGKLSLVVEIAKEYKNKGMLMEDIIGEGNMGLMNGVNHLHESKVTNNLNDFLASYIRASIENAREEYLDASNMERRVKERAAYMNDVSNELKEELGRNATIKELAEFTKLTIDEVKDIINMSGDSIEVEKHNHSYTIKR